MKRYHYLLLFIYSSMVVCSLVLIIFNSLDIGIEILTKDFLLTEQFFFSIIFSIFSITILLLFIWMLIDERSKRSINLNLRLILNNQKIKVENDSEINNNIIRLSKKMEHISTNLQNNKNERILNTQEVVKKERKRIARDLHDTVSQELFASSLVLSGLSQTVSTLNSDDLVSQIKIVEKMVQHAQNDLRILLLHLRPVELENKSLLQGLRMILNELVDKSELDVVFNQNLTQLPKNIEDNIFRIVQEFISNTLKHSKASKIEIYILQSKSELQLKMLDNGIGFNIDQTINLSYGLKNIKDRVDDLAGTLKILTSEGGGVSMEIRIPILNG
ncbi:MAG: sensor histidine kinase [Streptococcus sp.]|nr:sensor histidine kinase [Streptococcus sp.]